MILCLTPNPALDITHTVGALRPGAEHRALAARLTPGGKGLNTARVLDQLDEEVTVLGPLGAGSGQDLAARLGAEHPRIRQAFTAIGGETRRTVTILDASGATGVNEPGPRVTAAETARLRAAVRALLPRARALTIGGSLPPGMTGADVGDLVADARAAQVPVLVDVSGPALLAAADAGADLLSPNRAEALEATGAASVPDACHRLVARGARAVACSQGPEGMVAVRAEGAVLTARPPRRLPGNPTGAGDAAVAALARHLAGGRPLTAEALADAVATSAATLPCPVAGAIDLELRRRILAETRPGTVRPATPAPLETR
ncbi:hexose kinase [Brachybacterium phenoliresistens]|uniref:1-phosphofructokinase family hexose kinase n=1 Tax=Brachybacterium phenoliresistens TaxID=396014 RepID=UPI0031D73337